MGELKPGWTRYRFDQIAHNVNTRVDDPSQAGVEYYIGLEHLDSDSLKIRRWGSPEDVSATKLLFEPGDVIFGRRRAYQRKLGVAEFRGIASAHALVLRAKTDVVLPDFLPFFMQSDLFMERAQEISVGSLSPTVNWKTLARQEFALPPLEEQRRIVRVLTAAQSAVVHAQTTANTALEVSRAMLKSYFLDNLQAVNMRVGQIATVKNGTTPKRNRPEYWDGDVPWLPTGKVNERRILKADQFITKQGLSESSLNMIPANSTLVAMVGQGKTRGKVALLCFDATINQNFAAVIPSERIEPRFLFYQLWSKYELLRAWSQGTNQLALNCGLISNFPVWVPGLTQQYQIADELDEVDAAVVAAKQRVHATNKVLRKLVEVSLQG